MRGENAPKCHLLAPQPGSSPHARGKPHSPGSVVRNTGLIPACAGKTLFRFSGCLIRWAHPRMRGENPGYFAAAGRPGGSSPHARGKLNVIRSGYTCTRLIPACAGKTFRRIILVVARGAHPRMRGENRRRFRPSDFTLGSSPHARGKQSIKTPGACMARLIPACAGKTPWGRVGHAIRWAHPRMRGENLTE